MPEVQEEDEREPFPILLKSVVPAISKKESELHVLIEDLCLMGCEGLAKPWNLRSETILREFLFEKGNQWIRTMRHDPDNWIAEVWARVYGFPRGKGRVGPASGMVSMWESSERIRTRKTDSTLGTAETLESGGFSNSSSQSLVRRNLRGLVSPWPIPCPELDP